MFHNRCPLLRQVKGLPHNNWKTVQLWHRVAVQWSLPKLRCLWLRKSSRLLLIPKGRTIGELVNALNAIGVISRDLITILQAIKAAGALQGELEII